jgi:hypothetical protein
MKSIVQKSSLIALALVFAAGQAHAAKLCKLTGNYSDDYGSTTSIKGKKGSILNTAICATAYTFKISDLTQTGFTVKGKNPTKSCGKFEAGLTFQGSCSVFGGSVKIDGQTISDTFTKIGEAKHNQPAASALTDGLK